MLIAPSILSANLARLGEDVAHVVAAGADWIHVDVMDNHYVPNLTFGPRVCSALRDYGISVPMDVHLMVEPVDALIPAFAKAGARYITFHPEASLHVDRTIELIHEHGCYAGLALNPATPLNVIEYVIEKLDLILIMSVNPGFGGQKFIPQVLPKIQKAREMIVRSSRKIHLEVDGGINRDTIGQIAKAGADVAVAGSAIFNTDDYNVAIRQLRDALKS